MATETRIEGLADLHKLLQELPAKIEGNVMRGALRAGQAVIRDAVKAGVPVDDGELRNSVKIKFRPRSQKFGWVRMHLTAGDRKAWYAHLIEYGTASYYVGQGKTVGKPYKIKAKNGRALLLPNGGPPITEVTHPGIKPNPFMRPGFDAAQQPALEAVAAYIRTRLPKELTKAGK